MSCPDCFQGSVHEDKPKGEVIKLYDLDTYVARPASGNPPKAIIVIIPDAFGYDFVNNRILADHYAAKGDFLVYLPDFMLGHSAPVYMLDSLRIFLTPGFNMTKPYHLVKGLYGFMGFKRNNDFPKSGPIVRDFFSRLRAEQTSTAPPTKEGETRNLPIGAAGFCWGGKHAILLAQEPKSESEEALLVDAVFTGHPSALEIPGEIEHLAVPVSFAIPEKDNQVSKEKCEVIQGIVEKRNKVGGPLGEVKVYEDCAHGFCVRADLKYKDGEIAKQADLAEDQAIAWFERFLATK
ncbi:dienelactone hydrolase family protein [Rhypophila decipiens]|uniref:Dienelactone hydrolase family protein n=1 Tax=Rhypophila decipiens TaxID=261697 RepID=A0AAN6Y506_9PEZI|nr:dienelactone hydrolase family protein [Rhypophila decipiens]